MVDSARAYRIQIAEITERILRPYLKRLKRSGNKVTPRAKELNDAVWQTIVLSPLEVVFLDSPILQRLRRIRQLGVVHWTYPCAVHTRLEHSIGSVLQVQRLIDSMNRHHPDGGSIPSNWIHILRLAALCHDIGHGLMSHVSENALTQIPEVEKLRLSLREEFGQKCSLSEAAAFYIIGSPPFRELLSLAQDATEHKYPLPQSPTKILQNAILGKVVNEQYPLLHELISGPYDADKLDYMTRDAHATGVPTVTDIPRLVQKVRLVSVSHSDLPPLIAKTVSSQPHYFVNAVALSGARTLDELMLGRTLLFDKVYRHQKVRATEAMVALMIEQLAPLLTDRVATLPLLLDDDDIFALSQSKLQQNLQISLTEKEWSALTTCVELGRRLRDRELFVRAYAFSPYLPRDPFQHEPDRRIQHERVARDMENPGARRLLLKGIVAQLLRMRKVLPASALPKYTNRQFANLVALDPPPIPGETSPIARAYLVKSDQRLMPFREESPESSPWSNAYFLAKDLGYVFAAAELADAVFLASEFVFRTKYGIRTPESAREYAKVTNDRVGALRMKLTDGGFYNKFPNDLRAEAARLKMADIDGVINRIVQMLSPFEGLSTAEGNKVVPVRIDAERVRTWLRQFRTDAEIQGAISIVNALKMISRGELHDAIRAFVEQHPEFKGAYVCPYGSPKDSSHHLTYYVEDLAVSYGFEVMTLAEALGRERRPIIFIDDFVGSGQQAESVLMAWFGIGQNAPLTEKNRFSLSEAFQRELRERRLGFVFEAGEVQGAVRLRSRCDSLKLKAETHVHIGAGQLPQAFSGGAVRYESDASRTHFRTVCRRIGHELLASGSGKRRTKKWIDDRSLGYGNAGYLVVFPYNVPSQTLTLLWQSGNANGGSWLPLLPRRKKE